MVDKGKGSSGPAGPAGSGSSADVAKGRTLLAGPSGFPGLLAALNKKEGEADSDEGGSSGGKGRTVLGLPKHFVAAAREAQQASAGPAPTGPAAPSLIIPAGRVNQPESAPAPTPAPARAAAPAPASAAARPSTPAIVDEPEDPTDVEIETEMPGYKPTLKASAADLASFSEAPSAKRDTDPLLSTDPALSSTHTDDRTVAAVHEFAGKDADAGRVRLIAGKQIPGTRYRLVKWLGEGGMGVVYEAEHIDIERRVAMKILRLDLSRSPDTARIFRDEARAANRVGSRNIVQIHDFGELPDGRLYFCMELLQGFDLTARRDAGVDHGELIGILRQVCKGLGAAHQVGIVHRDIKPENILLVEEEGRAGMVKIVDFGVATILGGEGGTQIAGTPQYMPPEQIAGGAFDGRVDMYALGCTAYEMLVGRPPFDSESLEEVLMGHLQQAPGSPRAAKPDANIPEALEKVVLRCLAKEPGERDADMADLEAALCEAQIAAGLHSAWDDLPLPEVDPERKAWLLANMPSPFRDVTSKRPRWLWPLVAGIAVFLSVGITLARVGGEPPAAVQSEVDRLATEALSAAAGASWVTPPAEQPDAPTALQKVDELDRLGGDYEKPADARAAELRQNFAGTLVGLGDQLWDRGEGVRDFAVQYYEWALLFDPANARAGERAVLSEIERAAMRKRFLAGEFRESDFSSAEVAIAAVEVDQVKRDERIAKVTKRRKLSTTQRAVLDEQLEAIGVDEATRAAAIAGVGAEDGGSGGVAVEGATTGKAPAAPEPEPEPEPEPASGKSPKRPGKSGGDKKGDDDKKGEGDDDATLEKAERDPAKSQALAADGKAALGRGNRSEAETLFHQALAHDSRNTEALAGLSDIYFDRGSYQKAVTYAERAVKIEPTNKAFRIKLGDAYFGVLRYSDALLQYEKASDLGESRAAARIAKVKAKIGEG